jgi:hypothetical protein
METGKNQTETGQIVEKNKNRYGRSSGCEIVNPRGSFLTLTEEMAIIGCVATILRSIISKDGCYYLASGKSEIFILDSEDNLVVLDDRSGMLACVLCKHGFGII